MGIVCKGSAVVVFILDMLGSIVLGNKLGDHHFNWSIFLYAIIASFLLCLLLYSIGEIIDQLETSNSNTYELNQFLKKLSSEQQTTEPQKTHFTSSVSTVKKTADGGWICKKCGTKNVASVQFCKDCGEYK